MTKIQDIYNAIDKIAPFSSACDFDNSGLLIKGKDKDIKKIMVSLDATKEVIDNACEKEVDLLITHHPIIFKGIKKIDSDLNIVNLLKKDISVISAHTNFDMAKGGMNDILAKKLDLIDIKELKDTEGMGRIGELKQTMKSDEFLKMIKIKLKTSIRAGNVNKDIKKVALLGGSGGEFFNASKNQGADAFITGDVKHHQFIESNDENLLLIDAGHYGTEIIFIEALEKFLKEEFKDIEIIKSNQNPPYKTLI